MSTKSPQELFDRWLADRPNAARLVLCLDHARVIAWKPQLVDSRGRAWSCVVYRGDDVAFRRLLRDAEVAGRPIVWVAARGEDNDRPIPLTPLADVLSRVEGERLDLSLPALLHRLFPKANFPPDHVRRYRNDLLDRFDRLPGVYRQIKERWDEPNDVSRGEVAAMALLLRHPSLDLRELWCEETDVSEFLAHALRLLLRPEWRELDRPLVVEVIRQAARVDLIEVEPFLAADPAEVAAFLMVRELAGRHGLHNPAVQLHGVGSFSLDPRLLEPMAQALIAHLKADEETWRAVGRAAGPFLRPPRLRRILDLFGETSAQRLAEGILSEQHHEVLVQGYAVEFLDRYLADPARTPIAWARRLKDHPMLASKFNAETRTRALMDVLRHIASVEGKLALADPPDRAVNALMDWYVKEGIHLLEWEVSEAYRAIEATEDAALITKGQHYLFGRPEGGGVVGWTSTSLKGRVKTRLHALDETLGAEVAKEPARFLEGPRSATRMLRTLLAPALTQGNKRIWILLFDGMRLDTWTEVVRPILQRYFTIQEPHPFFASLPSTTHPARNSLFAGTLAKEWRGYDGRFTANEGILGAINLGVPESAYGEHVRFVTDAETTEARKRLGAGPDEARRINFLIYPISDDGVHELKDDLSKLNARVRLEMLGDKGAGLRGILDDLLRRIHSDDAVVVASDHGFVELDPAGSIEAQMMTPQEQRQHLFYRYVQDYPIPPDPARYVAIPGRRGDYAVAVGRWWFKRKDAKRRPIYEHGGLSFAELVVPGAVLTRITERLVRVELADIPEEIAVDEGAEFVVTFGLACTGTVTADCRVEVTTNLGQTVLDHQETLSAGATRSIQAIGIAQYTEGPDHQPLLDRTLTGIEVRLRYREPGGEWQQPPGGTERIRVRVRRAVGKVEISNALDVFGDME